MGDAACLGRITGGRLHELGIHADIHYAHRHHAVTAETILQSELLEQLFGLIAGEPLDQGGIGWQQSAQRVHRAVATLGVGQHLDREAGLQGITGGALQVGRIRREISYNGDTLNTAARIESMCNEYNKSLLISGDLYDMMQSKDGFYIKEVENTKLKGKRRKVDLYYVREKRSPGKQIFPQFHNALDKLNFYKNRVSLSELD